MTTSAVVDLTVGEEVHIPERLRSPTKILGAQQPTDIARIKVQQKRRRNKLLWLKR